MSYSRILAAILMGLLWSVWLSLDRQTIDDIPRTATKIAARVSRVVSHETSVLIQKLGFTEVPAEKVVAAPASPQRKPTRGPIRSSALSDATHKPTSDEAPVAPAGGRPADIDDSSEPIVVASEAGGTEETAAGEDRDGQRR